MHQSRHQDAAASAHLIGEPVTRLSAQLPARINALRSERVKHIQTLHNKLKKAAQSHRARDGRQRNNARHAKVTTEIAERGRPPGEISVPPLLLSRRNPAKQNPGALAPGFLARRSTNAHSSVDDKNNP